MAMRKIIITSIFLCLCCVFSGCSASKSNEAQNNAQMNSDATVGSLVQIVSPESVPVEGVGLVAGLDGKGSAECPTDIRKYLSQYILSELPSDSDFDADAFINSLNTAVVVIDGDLPVQDSSRPYFDLRVAALRGTQTVSLENGWLYRSELKVKGSFGINTEILADAEGPVFIDKTDTTMPDKKIGYILGGGKIAIKYVIGLVLNKPDFAMTNAIRNRLNMRYGENTARAVKSGVIEVALPDKYKEQRAKFVKLLKATYVYDVPQNDQERIHKHIMQLTENPQSDEGEIALEALGNQSLRQLYTILNSPDEHIRLRAARCMLTLRSDAGMDVLREIAMNRQSPYRIEALEAITRSGRSQDASALSLALLKDEDFNIRLAAYEQLRKLNDISIIGKPIAKSFYIENVTQTDKKDIYVSRSGEPKVVLFGAPLYCKRGSLIELDGQDVMIDALTDPNYVTVTRKYSNRPNLTGQIKCSYRLDSIIQALCEQPPERGQESRMGLGVSYCDLIALLEQMCDKGAVEAQFHAGPLPNFDLNIKK